MAGLSEDMAPDDRLAATLADVRARLQDKLDWMICGIEECKKEMADPLMRPGAMQAIAEIAHKISGVAGSVGFSDLGNAAAKIDIGFRKAAQEAAPAYPNDTLMADLETLLDQMEAAIEQ